MMDFEQYCSQVKDVIGYWCAVPNAGSGPSSWTTGNGVGQADLGNAHGFLLQFEN